MWILPTRSRPHNVERLLQAFRKTGAMTPVLMIIDIDDVLLPTYRLLPMPENWFIRQVPHGPLSDLYNDAYRLFPNLDWYGFIADDVLPETNGWDRLLIETAGRDGLAAPDDGMDSLLRGKAPHFVLGGDLVRSVGWLCLPELHRIYIDTVWTDIAHERRVFRSCPDVKLTHLHFANRGLADATYRKPDKAEDKLIYQSWKAERTIL